MTTKYHSEIVQILDTLIHDSKNSSDSKIDKRIDFLEIYKKEYSKAKPEIKWVTFQAIYKDAKSVDSGEKLDKEEKRKRVRDYLNGSFKKYLEKYSRNEGKNLPYKLALRKNSYHLELIPNDCQPDPMPLATPAPGNESIFPPKSLSATASFHAYKTKAKRWLKMLYRYLFSIFLEGILFQSKLVTRVKKSDLPRLDAPILFVFIYYFCIISVLYGFGDLYSHPATLNHPEIIPRLQQAEQQIREFLSLKFAAYALLLLLFLPLIFIPLFGFLRGDRLKHCFSALLSRKTYAQTLSYVIYNAAFISLVGTLNYQNRMALETAIVLNQINIFAVLKWLVLYPISFYFLYAYTKGYGLLLDLPRLSIGILSGADSGAKRPLIPIERIHPFRSKASTDSD